MKLLITFSIIINDTRKSEWSDMLTSEVENQASTSQY